MIASPLCSMGLETRAQLACLLSHDCNQHQGLLTSRAVVPAAFETLLRSTRLPQRTVLAA